jgi:GntR family transcriptional regulator, transcriptional repressor for pyruvate dehydrogenase complex
MAQTEPRAEGSTQHVVTHVRGLIERGELRPGDRLPAERDLAAKIGVSRPTVRAGLRALSAMGVVQSRHGSGTYIPDGPPVLGSEPLSFLAALHGFTGLEMYEARRILEVGAAGLAAERATSEQIATLAEEVASLFASLENPQVFLVHDINFHRSVAAASGNPIVASLMEMVSALYYERRRRTAERAAQRDLRDAAEAHRRIYQAIRAHDAEAARTAMNEHLLQASAYQAKENPPALAPIKGAASELPSPPAASAAERPSRTRATRATRAPKTPRTSRTPTGGSR